MSATPDEFRERSRTVWDAMAPGWEAGRRDLWEVSHAVSEWLVERLAPRPGQTILDVAAGLGDTGLLAAQRVGETGRVLITDFAPAMVAAARRRAAELGITNVEFRELDAERMSLEAGHFDGVVCRWGYMLMMDPGGALAETYRVMRPGGRLAFSVFGAPERNPWASLVGRVLVSENYIPPPALGAPGIFALSDPQRLRVLVTAAGFVAPEVEDVTFTWSFATADRYWWLLLEMAGAISPILRGLRPEAQARVRRQVEELARPFATGAGYTFPALCHNVATRKPA
jgi:ubiquinone/menaquinone biosynthesis C-methylase UbiE